jgi:hypothetical protein
MIPAAAQAVEGGITWACRAGTVDRACLQHVWCSASAAEATRIARSATGKWERVMAGACNGIESQPRTSHSQAISFFGDNVAFVQPQDGEVEVLWALPCKRMAGGVLNQSVGPRYQTPRTNQGIEK